MEADINDSGASVADLELDALEEKWQAAKEKLSP
jgi:hypothetical protein